MISLYNNHQNNSLDFKMDITGVETSDITPRLIIESDGKAHLIEGSIDGTKCSFDVPVLEDFTKGKEGRIFYEVIISEEQYMKVWEEKFEVISKTEVKVLESNFIKEEVKVKPTISLTSIEQVKIQPIKEEVDVVEEEEEIPEVEETIEMEEKVEETIEIEESKPVKEIYTEDEDVFSFERFTKNKNK